MGQCNKIKGCSWRQKMCQKALTTDECMNSKSKMKKKVCKKKGCAWNKKKNTCKGRWDEDKKKKKKKKKKEKPSPPPVLPPTEEEGVFCPNKEHFCDCYDDCKEGSSLCECDEALECCKKNF